MDQGSQGFGIGAVGDDEKKEEVKRSVSKLHLQLSCDAL